MEKDNNKAESNLIDKDDDVNVGPLANALRQHIKEYYNVSKETTQPEELNNERI